MAAPKTLSDAIAPLMTLNYLTGLRLSKYSRGRLRTALNLTYLLLLVGIYCKSIHAVYEYFKIIKYEVFVSALYKMITYLNAFVVAYEIVFGCFYTKKFNECYQRVAQIDETLRQLGAVFNYNEIYFLTVCSITFWFLYQVITSILILLQYSTLINSSTMIWLLMVDIYASSISLFVTFEFSIFVKCLQTKFKLVNKLLSDGAEISPTELMKLSPCTAEDYVENVNTPEKRQDKRSIKVKLNQQLQSRIQTVLKKRKLIRSRTRTRLSPPLKNKFRKELQGQSKNESGNPNCTQRSIVIVGCRKQKYLLQTIRQIYLELCRVSKTLCTSFGIQIALEIGMCTIFITGFLLDLYNLYETKLDISFLIFDVLSMIMIEFISVLQIILINFVCKNATNEGKKTNEIIHAIYGCWENVDMKEEIQQFGHQILQNPVEFSTFGISLNYNVLSSCLKIVTSYFVIMIQMSNSLKSSTNNQR